MRTTGSHETERLKPREQKRGFEPKNDILVIILRKIHIFLSKNNNNVIKRVFVLLQIRIFQDQIINHLILKSFLNFA